VPRLAPIASRLRAPALTRGDLPPRILTPPPGPRSRELAQRLAESEAPGVNTVGAGDPPILWSQARGANVQDVDGNLYVDLTAGFGAAAVGQRHPRVVDAVRRQASRLLHGLADVHAHPLRVELALALCDVVPVDEPRVFFATSGAEAVEIALKTALLSTGRPGIVAFEPAYHGLTLGALAVTSRPAFRQPFAAHLHPHVRRLPFGCPPEAVEAALGESRAGCLLVEPVVGREGVRVPPAGWLTSLAAACRKRRALLIADEVLTGFGRTGCWFAVEEEGVRPDLLCCGKALGGGLPIAAVAGRAPVMMAWARPGEALHTSTFLGNPLACAAALASLEVMRRERLPERAVALGRTVERHAQIWKKSHRSVSEVRGKGLLWGIELASARAAGRVVRGALERGVIVVAGAAEGRVVEMTPPLTITPPQLEIALNLLGEALADSGAANRSGR
jgi:4-aminobutyrate aminotransferase/(S)-3-amino-2-methylpropionate transaminase